MTISYQPPRVDYSTFPDSDGEPMAETLANQIQMIDLMHALHTLFIRQGRPAIGVGGNQLMYYNPENGREHISPDVYVTFAWPRVPPPSWRTWEMGGFPELVFEISSESTSDEDLGPDAKHKPAIYARLGVQEYYVYDPQETLTPPFRGFVLRDGRWQDLPVNEHGGIWSPLLAAELRPLPIPAGWDRPAGTFLRILDPRTGEPLPTAEEERARAEEQRVQAEEERRRAEAAEAEVARLRAELERLRGVQPPQT